MCTNLVESALRRENGGTAIVASASHFLLCDFWCGCGGSSRRDSLLWIWIVMGRNGGVKVVVVCADGNLGGDLFLFFTVGHAIDLLTFVCRVP